MKKFFQIALAVCAFALAASAHARSARLEQWPACGTQAEAQRYAEMLLTAYFNYDTTYNAINKGKRMPACDPLALPPGDPRGDEVAHQVVLGIYVAIRRVVAGSKVRFVVLIHQIKRT